ncbi:MAG: peptide deformylase [Dehalococcoidia bacterium]
MTVRPIRYLGDPVLRQPAKKVRQVDDSIRRLIMDMIESMYAAQGVGLAAPQIGVPLRVIVLGMPDEEPFALINPVIVKKSGTRRLEGEGCLSVPGYRAAGITRSQKVVVRGLDERGKEVRMRAEDSLLAQAFEHEVDHINGTLYVDRLDSMSDLLKLEGADWVQARPASEPAAVGGDDSP